VRGGARPGAGRKPECVGGHNHTFWVGVVHLRKLRAYGRRNGCRSVSDALRHLLDRVGSSGELPREG